ncbi:MULTISPECIES: cob(I)yrinic acid a,c-diamide adenosyltransferase [unclassified Sphingomonas]|jgi:cob(I)alamin adenosyltransferase|uniref:cob(I)yrinic acid a,c-diamide adenosyltransferase n=1 Tax=unclassified Sphingomonas TaxID=196159 RepID=UPI00082C659D|nr:MULTISPECIES: cob(I)yrinic acid a,c-diamide adenosyltransferase [unclassified Sphingomonas]MCH4893305.1 cob(I)yrinic acid a,c-diamide adenosyltransferase [Sphingomonas sp. SFZ2018-12]
MVRLNRIYTRTGDDGSTGLVDGSRVSKADPRIAVIGDVDEVNSLIGVASTLLAGDDLALLRRIQNDLFDLGADLATPGDDYTPGDMVLRIVAGQIAWLESTIDRVNGGLAPLTSFILPGGSPAAAALHVARATARRAERTAVAASATVPLNPLALTYLNRLSDFLFVFARHVNQLADGDVLWVPGASQ